MFDLNTETLGYDASRPYVKFGTSKQFYKQIFTHSQDNYNLALQLFGRESVFCVNGFVFVVYIQKECNRIILANFSEGHQEKIATIRYDYIWEGQSSIIIEDVDVIIHQIEKIGTTKMQIPNLDSICSTIRDAKTLISILKGSLIEKYIRNVYEVTQWTFRRDVELDRPFFGENFHQKFKEYTEILNTVKDY